MSEQKHFSVSLDREEARIVVDSSKALGISQSAVIRSAVRLMREIAEAQAKAEETEQGGSNENK